MEKKVGLASWPTFESNFPTFFNFLSTFKVTFQLFSTFFNFRKLKMFNFPTFFNFLSTFASYFRQLATCPKSCLQIARNPTFQLFQLSGNLRKLPASRRFPTFQLFSTCGQLSKVARASPKSWSTFQLFSTFRQLSKVAFES